MTTKNKSALISILICFFTSASFLGATELPPKFSEPVNLSNNPNQFDTMAAIAVDQSNRIHVAWIGTYANSAAPDGVASDVFYSCSSGSGFSDPMKITVPTGWYSRSPSIAADSTGNAHIAFRRSTHQTSVLSADDIYYVTNATGAFSSPVLLVDGISGILKPNEVSMPNDPIINCDGQDRIHLTFRAFGLGSGLVGNLLLYMNNATGTWTIPTLVFKGTHLIEHSVCVDRNNRVHIAFTDDTKIKYTNNTSGAFAEPIQASSTEHGLVSEPDLAIDSHGKAHIVYRAPFLAYLPEIYYVNNTSGSFSSWTPLDIDDALHAKPQVAVDNAGFVHVAYKTNWAYGGLLYYGNNSNGKFSVTTCDKFGDSWVGSSQYFAVGNDLSLHFAVYDWMGQSLSSDTEIFYLKGTLVSKDGLIGTWGGQGIYYRDPDSGIWTMLASPASQIAAEDLDGDGLDDLVGVWPASGTWVKYSSTGQWCWLASAADWIAAGETNGDGKAELIGIWNSAIWVRDASTGNWSQISSGASQVAAGDLDGDRKADLLGVWNDSGTWVRYSSSGQWVLLASAADGIAVGDMNGDGKMDLLGIWDSTVWMRDSATGNWSALTSGAKQVAAGDLDGDGRHDLIGTWSGSGVWVKYSSIGNWERLASPADWIAAGRLR